jgi:hypothetical protein
MDRGAWIGIRPGSGPYPPKSLPKDRTVIRHVGIWTDGWTVRVTTDTVMEICDRWPMCTPVDAHGGLRAESSFLLPEVKP